MQNKLYLMLFLISLSFPIVYGEEITQFSAERNVTLDVLQKDHNTISISGVLSIIYHEPLKDVILDNFHTRQVGSPTDISMYSNLLNPTEPDKSITQLENPAYILDFNLGSRADVYPLVTRIYDSHDRDIEHPPNRFPDGVWLTPSQFVAKCEKSNSIEHLLFGSSLGFEINSTDTNVFLDLSYPDVKKNNGTFALVFESLHPISINLPKNHNIINEHFEICYDVGLSTLDPEFSEKADTIKNKPIDEIKKNAMNVIYYYGLEFSINNISPLQQIKNNVPKENIICNFNHTLYFNGDTPLCLTLTTFEKLTLRGYFNR